MPAADSSGRSTISCPQCGTQVVWGSHSLCPNCSYPLDWAQDEDAEETQGGSAPGRRPDEEPDDTQASAPPAPPPKPPPPAQPPAEPPPAKAEEMVVCPACQTPNPTSRTYCQRCGHELRKPLPTPLPTAATSRRTAAGRPLVLAGVVLVVVLASTMLLVRSWNSSPSAGGATTTSAAPRRLLPRPVPRADIQASASSIHQPTAARTFEAGNTLDGRVDTSWQHNGPGGGDGVGETLTYRFRRPVRLARIEIVNGSARSDQSFQENNRIEGLVITTDQVRESWTLQDTASPQRLSRGFGVTTKVQLRVTSVYPGSRFHDLAVSEVVFFAI